MEDGRGITGLCVLEQGRVDRTGRVVERHEHDPPAGADRRCLCRHLDPGDENLLPPIRAALKDHCSVGEVCGAMREVFGEYQPES